MALNFPPLPLTVGQQYTYNAITWFWNGTAWELLTATDAVFGTLSATSYNKVVITTPATSATLTVIDGTTITLPATTGTVALNNQQFYIGSTQIAINRATGAITLNSTSIDGNAGTVTDGVVTTGSYADPSWITSLAASKVGLGNVTNESKATMFTSPTFTGTVAGVTATHVGLGNVTNESKATMFTSPAFTGTPTGITATHVGLGNVTNESKATMFTSPSFTGTVSGVTATAVGLGNVTNESKATMFTSPSFTGTVSGVTATAVGLGNVTNESKATMFTNPNFLGNFTAGTNSASTVRFNVGTGTPVNTTTVTGYMIINVNGVNRYFPYYT